MLLVGLANVSSVGAAIYDPVDIDTAAELVVGNTVVVDAHPRSRYDVSRRYYQSLERVYACSKEECETHGVQVVDGQICEPELTGRCLAHKGQWFFATKKLAKARRGARIGSFVVTPDYGRPEVHAILKGNVTGYPDFTIPPSPLEPVTVDAKDALPDSEDIYGQFAGRDLGRLFPGNTLVNTDGTLKSCLQGAEYYAPGGQVISLGCWQNNKKNPRIDYAIWLLRWRVEKGNFCTTGRMDREKYLCLTGSGQNDAHLAKTGPYPPRSGELAVQLPSSQNAPLLQGNIFHFRF